MRTPAWIATITAIAALLLGPAVVTAAPVGAAPTCMPGDERREGYQCSPAVGWGITPGDCIQVWKSYPSPMHLETVCRGPR